MARQQPGNGWRAWLVAAALLPACASGSSTPPTDQSPEEHTGQAQQAAFVNGDFEPPGSTANAAPPTPWVVQNFYNPTAGVTIQTPQTRAGLNLTNGGALDTIVVAGTGTVDPDMGATAGLRYCRYGQQCARINFHSRNSNALGHNVNSLSQTMTTTNADVDPADGLVHVRLTLAPVLEDPNHNPWEQPYFFIQVTNVTKGNAVLYSDFNFANQPGVPWQTISNGGLTYKFTDWQLVDVAPGSAKLAVGDQVSVEVIGAGCSLGGHEGYVYVDSFGSTVPGLFIGGTGPAQVNAGSNITYTLSYKNGSAASESGVVIDFTTPPGTTYQGITPPAGATCTTPAIGAVGTIVCTFANPVAAGAGGSFTVTVNVPAGTAAGQLNCGNYDIKSAQENALLGAKIVTLIGCSQDAHCTAAQWCNIAAGNCTADLANGTPIPIDTGHTTPTLTGVCTAAAGALVCTSGVCDTADGKCGYANGDGTCTSATATTVCRSGVCDPDGKCGYANGDGPCTTATGGTVCRSGTCSLNGLCMAAGGCNLDADCTGGKWCMESTHTCTVKYANSVPMPTDPPHTNPTLDGNCTAAAGTLICASGVCDTSDNRCGWVNGTTCSTTTPSQCRFFICDATDNKCGYANGDGPCTAANAGNICRSGVCDPDLKCGYAVGDGPCTAANAGKVCRTGACSVALTCMPAGGCNVDADCAAGNWCMESTHTCTPKLANGTAMPNDPPHTAPTLNGTCTAAGATLVCASGACDTKDNLCGYALGDGPCTAANGATVCRTGACSVAGTCMPPGGCNVDADCTGGNWCMESTHTCTPQLANGAAMPTDGPHTNPTLNGTCTAAGGALVCMSGACDPKDNACGLANGDGPCTTGNPAVCRSGACSNDGTCMPVGGCNVDADCSAGNWCNISQHACTAKIPNGGVMPSDSGHTNPVLNAKCTTAAASAVCVSGVCDPIDDRCGWANGDGTCTVADASTCRSGVCDPDLQCGYKNGDGPCTVGNGPAICRSGACSPNGSVCMPVGGCAVDADCGASQWCNSETFTCQPKLANGTDIPTVTGHNPALTGACTTGAGTAVCDSGVCDANDNKCGYADGDGPCTAATGIVVCRSGFCSATGVCQAAEACQVDADCDTTTQYCDTPSQKCAPKLPNGMPMPTVTGHAPTLDGECNATEAPIVCQSAVCDANDQKCGYANGDGPCTATTAGMVCRSSTCSPNAGVCVPSGGCAVDADCASTQWCDTSIFACVAKLPNGDAIPTVTGHNPALTGACTAGAGAAVCLSGVCDTNDNKCGYANGDGPCTKATAGTVCRAGACDAGGLCTNPAACTQDSDCDTTYQYCDTGAGKCAPKVPNGEVLPGVTGHSPPLDGTCSPTAAQITCMSGVCDAVDGKCGHAIGQGPCTAADGATVCRSQICATSGANAGLCEECVADAQCAGAKPVCDLTTNLCVQCTKAEDAACAGSTPVCVAGPDTCAPCDADFGANSPRACGKSGAPYCFLSGLQAGECGKCTSDADCVGHQGDTCNTATGACVNGCTSDSECQSSEWCNAPDNGVGTCTPKLDNGTHLPTDPPSVVKCSDAVGARVCVSGVCDPADDTCGLKNGDKTCTADAMCRSGACEADKACGWLDGHTCSNDTVCRNGKCDTTKGVCGAQGCTKDSECPEADYCAADGSCKPRLPDGDPCTADNQCQSAACHSKICDGIVAQGNGVACAARPSERDGGGTGAVILGVMLAAAGLARRRRR